MTPLCNILDMTKLWRWRTDEWVAAVREGAGRRVGVTMKAARKTCVVMKRFCISIK